MRAFMSRLYSGPTKDFVWLPSLPVITDSLLSLMVYSHLSFNFMLLPFPACILYSSLSHNSRDQRPHPPSLTKHVPYGCQSYRKNSTLDSFKFGSDGGANFCWCGWASSCHLSPTYVPHGSPLHEPYLSHNVQTHAAAVPVWSHARGM